MYAFDWGCLQVRTARRLVHRSLKLQVFSDRTFNGSSPPQRGRLNHDVLNIGVYTSMSKVELITSYKYEKGRLAKVEKALEIQKKKISDICKDLFDQHGKGPHDLSDGNTEGYIVVQNGDKYYLKAVPAKKAGK